MQRAKRFRLLVVLAICGAAHGVLLLLLAVKTPTLSAKSFTDRPEATITLLQNLASPRAEKVRERKATRTEPSPQQAPPATGGAAPASAALTDLVEPVYLPGRRPGSKERLKGLTLATGCDDPGGAHLTEEQREKCRNRWGGTTKAGLVLPPLIDKGKQADFERRIWCRDKYALAGVPVGTSSSSTRPIGSAPEDGPGKITGLGYIPSFKECPAADR